MTTAAAAIPILELTCREFVQQMRVFMSANEARSLYQHIYRRGTLPAEGSTTLPPLSLPEMPLVQQQMEGDTVKFTQSIDSDLETESVLIPGKGSSGRPRTTLCVSSQIGCAMGCGFCETAQMGLMQNLTAAQIVGQWFAARHLMHSPVTNIVFMGMGEPMDNYDAVEQAILVLTDHNGPSIAPSRLTVSTVGRTEGIRRYAELARREGFHGLKLAVSINAPNDEVRSAIMPINRAEPMAALMDAMRRWPGRVLIEYVLIPGVNDDPAHAGELCEYLQPIDATVNVIPYNPRRDSPWPAPDEQQVQQFVQHISGCGQPVRRRVTTGRSVMAACGQLGNQRIRKRRYVELSDNSRSITTDA